MLGRGNRDEARRAGYTGIALCTGIMVVSAGILIVARHASPTSTPTTAPSSTWLRGYCWPGSSRSRTVCSFRLRR
jgi:hypothetical protein